MAHAIRVKDLKSYKLIPEIIDAFKDEGIAFLPGKKVKPYYGLIRVTKYFLMDPITDCTLQDSEIDSMKYFQVPIKLEWDEFEEMTKHVKRNINDSNWDGALATIYRKTGIEDHIRIFCEKDSSLEKLNEIRKKYVQEIKKIMGK
jgi:hypothetical protein